MLKRIIAFFARDWPNAARELWLETVIAVVLTILGAVVAYVLTMRDSTWFYSFVSPILAGERGPTAPAEELRATLFSEEASGLSIFATFLFTHNAQIALLAFALGFVFCLPAAYLVLYNGMMLGAFVALFASHGLGVEFGGWVLIHGTTELFAIALAGAAGFRIGWTLAFPGSHSRVEAMSAAGRKAAIVMTGVVIMLGVAGALEGVGRQVINDTGVRYAIATLAMLLWLAYLYIPRKGAGE